MQNDAKTWKITETLAYVYSSKSTQWELSYEYQLDRVWMVIENLCIIVLWTKVASALEGLMFILLKIILKVFIDLHKHFEENFGLECDQFISVKNVLATKKLPKWSGWFWVIYACMVNLIMPFSPKALWLFELRAFYRKIFERVKCWSKPNHWLSG